MSADINKSPTMWDDKLNKPFDPIDCLLYRSDKKKLADMKRWINMGGRKPTLGELRVRGAPSWALTRWKPYLAEQ